MEKKWWKILSVAILTYAILGALLFDAPRLNILNETIRNLHFHVTMWFGMIILLTTSMVYAIRYLRTGNQKFDTYALEFANVGILFAVLGLVTGAVWANYAWGEPWSGDPKQNGAAVCFLIYCAYLVLRNSINDEQQRGRISSIYNIFAFAALIPLLFILPRMTDSLHPATGRGRAIFLPTTACSRPVWTASLNWSATTISSERKRWSRSARRVWPSALP